VVLAQGRGSGRAGQLVAEVLLVAARAQGAHWRLAGGRGALRLRAHLVVVVLLLVVLLVVVVVVVLLVAQRLAVGRQDRLTSEQEVARVLGLGALGGPIAQDAVDGGDGGRRSVAAHALLHQFLSNFPSENRRVLPLVLLDLVHHRRRGHLGLGAANHRAMVVVRVLVGVVRVLVGVVRVRRQLLAVRVCVRVLLARRGCGCRGGRYVRPAGLLQAVLLAQLVGQRLLLLLQVRARLLTEAARICRGGGRRCYRRRRPQGMAGGRLPHGLLAAGRLLLGPETGCGGCCCGGRRRRCLLLALRGRAWRAARRLLLVLVGPVHTEAVVLA